MKKVTLSIIAALAMSTFAVAGGDIAPVEPEVTVPDVVESTPGAFYVGIAYGLINADETATITGIADDPVITSGDEDTNSVMLQAGYKFNPYIAVEGRYWINADGDDLDVWGVYAKPMYPVTEAFDIYGLLGYASLDTNEYPVDMDGFSWGIGASYAFTENLSVFVDYTSLYDDDFSFDILNATFDIDTEVTSWNFGVTYTF